MSSSGTLCIVGGGVIGLFTGYYAQREGWDVTVIDRGTEPADNCSIGNAGMIVPSHFVPLAAPGMISYGLKQLGNPESPFWVRPRFDLSLLAWGWKFARAANAKHVAEASPILRDMNLRSRALYAELAQTPGFDFGLVMRGLLMLCETEHVLAEEAKLAERANQLGVPAEVLDPAGLAKADPAITMKAAGAILFPKDAHLTPSSLMRDLTAALKSNGAKLLCNTEAQSWQKKGGQITSVMTSKGQISADEFVLAGGSWSPELLKSLGISLSMQAGKGYSFDIGDPVEMPELCSILAEARVAVTPMGNKLRFAGTMEITGLDLSINQRRVDGIRKSIPRFFPKFTADTLPSVKVWSGLRPCSPDGLPYIGRISDNSNLIVATGHSMMGLSLGPVTGEMVNDLLAHRKPEISLGMLKVAR